MSTGQVASAGATATLVATLVLATPIPANSAPPPPGACTNPEQPSPAITAQPWEQRMLDPRQAWQHSTGAGVLVAVVDSGVDGDHPQLSGKVQRGEDFYLVGDLPGDFDCSSHGTAAASIVAGSTLDGTGFAGIAPNATVLPVRVVERAMDGSGAREEIDYNLLADGIRYAADAGARVINLSLSGRTDHPAVREAVAHARSRDALVVAAAGNMAQDATPGQPTYPAAYDGVIGVGAVNMAGEVLGDSQTGPQVDLVAPGDGVTGAARASGHQYWKGTSFAAPFVSGTAALVRAAHPDLSADEVADRLLATATPAPGGRDSTSSGAGLVNPYRAVTDVLSDTAPSPPPQPVRAPADPEQVRAAAWWSGAARNGKLIAATATGAALLGASLVVVLVRGRRSGWRPRRAAPVADERSVTQPPDEVFLLPPPPSER